MSQCRDENESDGHGHGHSHGDHDHDHDHDGPDRGAEESLFSQINQENVRCLNESEPGAGKKVIKPWHERNDTTKYVESDADEQLIFFIPFTGSVKLKSILIKGGPGDSCPAKLKAFINRDDIDFSTVERITPTQEWDLVQTGELVEYQTKMTKMYNVRNLTLFIPDNYGDDLTRISFLGFKGEWMAVRRDPIITIYEASANPADHKTPASENRIQHGIQ